MVDSSHAALMSAKQIPPSPEHIPIMLKEIFVDTNNLKMKYVVMMRDLYILHRKIVHGDLTIIKGEEIDLWQKNTEEFMQEMTRLVKEIIEAEKGQWREFLEKLVIDWWFDFGWSDKISEIIFMIHKFFHEIQGHLCIFFYWEDNFQDFLK